MFNTFGRCCLEAIQIILYGFFLAAPSAPQGPMQFSDLTDKSVTISWRASASDGGLPLKEYVLERRDTKRTSWAPVDKVSPDITSYTVQNLVVGNDYYFRVMAVNEEGTSPPLEGEPVRPQKGVEAPSVPRGPLNISDVTGSSAALTWKLADQDGGSPITGYLIEASTDNENWNKLGTVDKLSNKYKAQNLEDGKDYTFRVSAVNKVGPSQPLVSKPVSIKKPAEAPSKPLGPITTSDINKDSVTLSWQPPESDGGSPLTEYVIEKRDTKRNTWAPATKVPANKTSCVVDKLQEGSDYMFRVSAVNKKGSSKPLESESPVTAKSPFGMKSLYLCLFLIVKK